MSEATGVEIPVIQWMRGESPTPYHIGGLGFLLAATGYALSPNRSSLGSRACNEPVATAN
jgi:hypothetical protein